MTQPFRVPGKGRLKPALQVNFSFDGRPYTGVEGDTLASALLANGVHLVGRSFKYHRPRGILSDGVEEPNALVTVAGDAGRRTPNVRATVQELHDGLAAMSQNRWPSLAHDFGAAASLAAPLLSTGFYYKTFMWPRRAWKMLYEPAIRLAAGLGEAPAEPDPDTYASRFAHCDVLVVGGGPAGLSAALAAAEAGARVILADERPEFGGSLRYDTDARIGDSEGWRWAQAVAARLSRMDNVRLLPRATAFGLSAQNFVGIAERLSDHLADPDRNRPRERLWQVRARQVVLAAGAIERHMVFPGNDRPGIMLAAAARAYLNQYGVAVGRQVGVYTADDGAYAAALDLHRAGIRVVAIVDLRDAPEGPSVEAARAAGIEVNTGRAVVATSGRLRISSMTVAARDGGPGRRIAVDALLVSAGWTPSIHLYSQSGGKVAFDERTQSFLPDEKTGDCICVGACGGSFDFAASIEQAQAAGRQAARRSAASGIPTSTPPLKAGGIGIETSARWTGGMIGAAPGAGPQDKGRAFVDFQNDVTAKDIRLAVREGFRSIEHVKRFTTNGMATDQGKTSNMHGLAIAAEALGKSVPEVGLTTFRAPYTPVTFGTLAAQGRGALFDPTRRTPIHGWAQAHGAVFEDVGPWKRARFFPKPGEDMRTAVDRECTTVRRVAGLFDASTLGKIEVVGPDAAAFLELLYANSWRTLKPGRCRYGLMLREDGFVFDDGVVGRLAQDRFHVTTTTGGAARVLHHMEDYLQTEFPHLNVWLTSTTEQWAVIAVQGPGSREIVAPLVEGIDLSDAAMPHLSVREGRICGVPTRLFRVSFTGERGFEVNVPADHGEAVWESLWGQGQRLGACAYGTEAMHVLRAEKGHIIVGQDTDGTVTADDAGLGWLVGKTKTDFVGIRGLKRAGLLASGRRQLVGLLTCNPTIVLEEGAQIVADPNQAIPMTMEGHVTSSYWSATCGRSIALALVADGRGRIGETLHVPMPGGCVEVEVTKPVFLDAEGGRLHG